MTKVILIALACLAVPYLMHPMNRERAAVTIKEQGSFMIGGSITRDDHGHSFHGDHGYVFYQKPLQPHKLPVVFLHGIYQSSETWESTPDGRDGFQNIFPAQKSEIRNLALEEYA